MSDVIYPYQQNYRLDENSVALDKYVILKIVSQGEKAKKYGDIHMPENHYVNMEMLKGEVVSVGHAAQHEGLEKGDIVVYDRYATFGNPPREEGIFVIIDIDNIIAIVEE